MLGCFVVQWRTITLRSGTNWEAAHERTPSLLLYPTNEVQALVTFSHRSDLLRLPVTAACSAGEYPKSLRMELATNKCVSHWSTALPEKSEPHASIQKSRLLSWSCGCYHSEEAQCSHWSRSSQSVVTLTSGACPDHFWGDSPEHVFKKIPHRNKN